MDIKKLFILMFVFAVTSLACGVNAANYAPQQNPTPQITNEQLSQAYKAINEQYPAVVALGQTLTAKYNELNNVLMQPTPDKARIESLSREIGELRGKLLSARADIQTQLQKNGLPPDFYDFNIPQANTIRNTPYPNYGWRGHHRGFHHGGFGGYHGYNAPCPWAMMGGMGYGMMDDYGCGGPCW